jgi:5-methylcytosine-specific restriction endonuclease McrA
MNCGTISGNRQHYKNNEKPCDACKQAKKKYDKEYNFKNKEKRSEYRKKYASNLENKEKAIDYHKRYRSDPKNKERKAEVDRIYRIKNIEKISEYDKKRKSDPKNIDKVRSYTRKSERKRRSMYSEPYSELQVINKYGTKCYICNQEINFNAPRRVGLKGWEIGLHIDHFIPISKGGLDVLENVRPAHGLCNIKKSDRILDNNIFN